MGAKADLTDTIADGRHRPVCRNSQLLDFMSDSRPGSGRSRQIADDPILLKNSACIRLKLLIQ